MKRLFILVLLMTAGAAGAVIPHSALAAQGGNSAAAHACQQGGYQNLVGGTPPAQTITFSNTGECVSYAAHGGTLYQVSTASFTVQTINKNWQDTVNLANGASATITFVDNNASCATNGYVCTPFSPCGACTAPNVEAYVLTGKVDSNPPFEVQSGMTVTGPGELSFVFNDGYYDDNTGSYTVTVTTYTPLP